jgi:hypothetical protein
LGFVSFEIVKLDLFLLTFWEKMAKKIYITIYIFKNKSLGTCDDEEL